MNYIPLILVALLTTSAQPLAQTNNEPLNDPLNNLAHDFAQCSAYFLLVANAPRIKEDSPGTAASYEDAAEQLISYSARLTTSEQAFARQELAFKSMMRMMENDWSKISIVMNEYLYPCKDLAESPEQRLKELLEETK